MKHLAQRETKPCRNLDDGTHIIHTHRYAQLEATRGKIFIPAHRDFRVIAIAAPVPPYPGHPLDPPFRSRFQARFIDPLGSQLALQHSSSSQPSAPIFDKLRDLILSTQLASESRSALEVVSKSSLPPFPQTALMKLRSLSDKFPPLDELSPSQLARLLVTLHPGLVHAPFQAWAILTRQTEAVGLGELGSPAMSTIEENTGYFGYCVARIQRSGDHAAQIIFSSPKGRSPVTLIVPAGPKKLRPFPFVGNVDFNPSPRFMSTLTCFLQAHALGWDISLIPPALPSTASTSTSTLIKVFSQFLGYEDEVIHMYKELGGRELVMRRRIDEGGATSWEPRYVLLSLSQHI